MLIVWNDQYRVRTSDSWAYLDLAGSLTNLHFGTDDYPETFRTPGYPLFLAPFGALEKVGFKDTWHWILAVQVALDVLLVYLVFLLGKMLIGPRTGLLAAFIQAITPGTIASSCRILSDGLFSLLLTAGLLCAIVFLRRRRSSRCHAYAIGKHSRLDSDAESMAANSAAMAPNTVAPPRWRWLIAASLLLAAACYVRPVGLAMSAAFVLAIAVSRAGGIKSAVVMAAILIACLGPWVVRNSIVADYRGFSTFATDSMFYFSLPPTLAASQGITEEQAHEQLIDEYWRRVEAVEPSPPEPNIFTTGMRLPTKNQVFVGRRISADMVREVLLAHPGTYAKIHLRGDVNVLMPDVTDPLEILGVAKGERGTLAVLREKGLWAAAENYFGGQMWALAIAIPLALIWAFKIFSAVGFAIRRFTLRLPAEVWLMIGLVLLAVLLPGPAGHPRFRLPVEPILSVAAAGLWMYRKDKKVEVRRS